MKNYYKLMNVSENELEISNYRQSIVDKLQFPLFLSLDVHQWVTWQYARSPPPPLFWVDTFVQEFFFVTHVTVSKQ